MTADASFERYHVLMFRWQRVTLPLLGRVPLPGAYPVFTPLGIDGIGPDVRVGQWRRFEGDVLRAYFGEKWPIVLAKELTAERRTFLRIEGEDASGQRVRLPSAEAAAPMRRSGRRAGSGMGVLVRHLRDVEGVEDYHGILAICDQSGTGWVLEALQAAGPLASDRVAMLRKAFSNGKQPHAEACPYCMGGLPEALKPRRAT